MDQAKIDQSKPSSETNLVLMGLIVEGGLVVLALLFGWLEFCSHDQPLTAIANYPGAQWVRIIVWGLLATLPMLVYLVVFHYWTPTALQPMQQFVDLHLKPMFRGASILKLLVLSLMAGFCEELFFRWCLQGGITSFLEPTIGFTSSVLIGLAVASLIFGACHWVNASYGITTLIVGVYLGVAMVWSGSWLVPAIAHALFDFVAMIYIARWPARATVS